MFISPFKQNSVDKQQMVFGNLSLQRLSVFCFKNCFHSEADRLVPSSRGHFFFLMRLENMFLSSVQSTVIAIE